MKKHLLALCFIAASGAAHAESGLWYGIDATHDFNKRLALDLSLGSRIEEDGWSRYTRYDVAGGLDWKALSWLKLGIGYDFIRDYSPEEIKVKYKDDDPAQRVTGFNVDESYWRSKHRLFFDITGKLKCGRFTFALRERYQYTRYTPIDNLKEYKYRYRQEYANAAEVPNPYLTAVMPDGTVRYFELDPERTELEKKSAKDKHYLRSRLSVEYNIRHCPLTPFVSYEVANDLGESLQLVRQRVQAGFDYKIRKGHTLSLAYLYQHGEKEETGDADFHVLSLGYKFKF